MTQVVAEDRTVKNAEAANWLALTKILTLGPQLSEAQKILSSRQRRWNYPQIVVSEKNFLWGISFRSWTEIFVSFP